MDKAKSQRAGAKSWLTRSENALKTVITRSAAEFDAAPATSKKKLEIALRDFDARLAAYDAAQQTVEELLKEEEMEAEITATGAYRDGVMETRCEAEVALDQYAQAMAPPNPSLPSVAELLIELLGQVYGETP